MFRKQGIWLMAVLLIALSLLIVGKTTVMAQGGADYGRGAETDPVATALINTVSQRVSRVETGTNAWNGATANATNWLIHAAAMVQDVTNVIVSADSKTNTIVVNRGSVKSWVVTQ